MQFERLRYLWSAQILATLTKCPVKTRLSLSGTARAWSQQLCFALNDPFKREMLGRCTNYKQISDAGAEV
eukprot:5569279-Pleurochrysis_carterae.AAC.2